LVFTVILSSANVADYENNRSVFFHIWVTPFNRKDKGNRIYNLELKGNYPISGWLRISTEIYNFLQFNSRLQRSKLQTSKSVTDRRRKD